MKDLGAMEAYLIGFRLMMAKREHEGGSVELLSYGGSKICAFDPEMEAAAKQLQDALDHFDAVVNRCEDIAELYAIKVKAHTLHYQSRINSECDWSTDVLGNSHNSPTICQPSEHLLTNEYFCEPDFPEPLESEIEQAYKNG
jgi:hypothetical protein